MNIIFIYNNYKYLKLLVKEMYFTLKPREFFLQKTSFEINNEF